MSKKKQELVWYRGGVQEKHRVGGEYELGTVSELIGKLKEFPEDAKVDMEVERGYYDDVSIYLDVSWWRDPTPEELEEKVAADKKQKVMQEQAAYRQLNELAKRLGKKVV
jgi:hypothetical protein